MDARQISEIKVMRPRGRVPLGMRLMCAAATMQGLGREENEDRVRLLWVESAAVFCMADGLGGHAFGGEAAETVTKHAFLRLRRELPRVLPAGVHAVRSLLLSTVWSAGGELALQGQTLGVKLRGEGLATTLILVVALENAYVAAWIGDGGVFVVRSASAVDRLLVPDKSPDAPTLLEAFLSPEPEGAPSFRVAERRPGDVLVVTTDGIADLLPIAQPFLNEALVRANGNAASAARASLRSVAQVRNAHGRAVFRDDLTLAILLTPGTPAEDSPGAVAGSSRRAGVPGASRTLAETALPTKVAAVHAPFCDASERPWTSGEWGAGHGAPRRLDVGAVENGEFACRSG